MPEKATAALSRRGACLTLNEVAAAVNAPPELSGDLREYFQESGVRCSVARLPCGREVIDFGDPSPDEERRIRALFAAWRIGGARWGVLSEWYVWVALAVVAAWLVMAFMG